VRTLAGDREGFVDLLNNIGGWELIVIILIGLFIFGPDRLPKAIGEGARMLRQLRNMARNATSDLSKELGTTIELEDLRPKTFLRKHLLSEEDEKALRAPLENLYTELRSDLRDMGESATEVATAVNGAKAAVASDMKPSLIPPLVDPTAGAATGPAATATGAVSGTAAVAGIGADTEAGGPVADASTGVQPGDAAPSPVARRFFDADAT
jgi:sec-independent protein translocase protein TatB